MVRLESSQASKACVSQVRSLFSVPLERLHEVPPTHVPVHDQDSWAHRLVYRGLNQVFYHSFHELTEQLVISLGLSNKDWVVQLVPTFRFHFVGGTGTKEYHRDADYNHTPFSINVVLPCTEMAGSSAIKSEVVPYSNRYELLEGRSGEPIIFHGALCNHGTDPNWTTQTRVSFDFRFAQRAALKEGLSTVNKGVKLSVGHYYREI